MSAQSLRVGDATFTRVLLADAPVPGAAVGLTPEQIAAVPWADDALVDGDQVRVGVAIWVLELGERRIVLDPMQAADAFLRADPETEAAIQLQVDALLTEAGFPPDSIDTVLLTHIDNVGMVARRDGEAWRPFFPNAEVRLSSTELASFAEGAPMIDAEADPGSALVVAAWRALIEAGVVAPFEDGDELAPGLVAEVSGGHQAGHAVLHYNANGTRANEGPALSFIGHLAVSPLHLATGPCAPLNEDPARAFELLGAVAADGRLLVGPLWPSPGVGRWQDDRFTAAA